jgi:hypothetical protein
MNCASDYAYKRTKKTQQRRAKEIERKQKQEFQQRKKALKTKPQWMQEAQSAFNKYIRTRDRYRGCISCGAVFTDKYGGAYDSGHYRSRGAAGHLRFHLQNSNGQCVRCNRYNSGAVTDYRLGLIKRYGIDVVERIEQDHTSKVFTVEYLERIKRIFNKRARLYQKLRGL